MPDKKEKVVVCLNGGGPWGFRLQGGSGTGLPLVVSKVRRKSKAYKRLYEGDLILSVNDHCTKNLTYDQVMEIADKSGTDLTLEVLRQESNKENQIPPQRVPIESTNTSSPPLKRMENGAITKEIISLSETNTKITEEKEGLRIKSANLLPKDAPSLTDTNIDNFTSQKLSEDSVQTTTSDDKTVDSFPKFEDLLQTSQGPPKAPRSPIDTSTSSKTEEVTGDDNSFVKTIIETKQEMKGDTEMSFIKKEQESVSKSVADGNTISTDAMDLNNLICETQKKLDSFKNGFKTDVSKSEVSSSVYEVKKIETTKSTSVTESKGTDLFSFLNEAPFYTPAVDSSTKESGVDSKQDLAALNGGLGFTSDESSFVSTETPFGSTSISKKKKMFSSSSFYEEPDSLYPTMEEQVEMARKIADSLADDTNKKSKGREMFYKRVKKSPKWIHEGPEPSDESGPGTPEFQGGEHSTPDPYQVPFRPSKGPPKLKLVLDPRHTLDVNALRSSGLAISEHNVVSPEVCHGLVKDLHSPVGKGAALFAKRKKKSEEWVVDEEKVKALLREHEKRPMHSPQPSSFNQYSSFNRPVSRQDVKLVKTPWEAAMESPYGLCDAAFARVNPDELADTVIKAADTKRRNSNTPTPWESSGWEGCFSPTPVIPVATQYDIYHAKAPKGWTGVRSTADPLAQYQTQASATTVSSTNSLQRGAGFQNGVQSGKKMVFQNFNTVPRMWKGASAR